MTHDENTTEQASACSGPARGDAAPSPPAKRGSAKSRITGALFYTFLAIAVLAVFLFSGSDKAGAPRNFFGFSFLTVLTGSMQSEIPKGSFVIGRQVGPETLQVGNDITFFRHNGSTVTHRIIAIYENYEDSGKRGFETKGTDNPLADRQIVSADLVIGKVVFHHLAVGNALSYLKENLLVCALLGAMVVGLLAALHMAFSSQQKQRKPNPRREAANDG